MQQVYFHLLRAALGYLVETLSINELSNTLYKVYIFYSICQHQILSVMFN